MRVYFHYLIIHARHPDVEPFARYAANSYRCVVLYKFRKLKPNTDPLWATNQDDCEAVFVGEPKFKAVASNMFLPLWLSYHVN